MGTYDRVGYLWSLDRIIHFSLEDLSSRLKLHNILLVQINPEIPVTDQGPFKVIIHKMAATISRANNGYEKDIILLRNLKRYIERYPTTVLLDPLPNVEKLINRSLQYDLIRASLAGEDDIYVPEYTALTSIDRSENEQRVRDAGLRFPLICKSFSSCGLPESHEMTVIFDSSSLKDASIPCLAQTFVNHNATLYKLYGIGDIYRVVQRPSVRDLEAGDYKTLKFHSSISRLRQPPVNAPWLTKSVNMDHFRPVEKRLDIIHKLLAKSLGLSLFGVDIIVDSRNGRHAIIDINSFPGYGGVEDFVPRMAEFLIRTSGRTTDGSGNTSDIEDNPGM